MYVKDFNKGLIVITLISSFLLGCSATNKASQYDKFTTQELQSKADMAVKNKDYKQAIYYLEGLEFKPDVIDIDKVQLDLINAYYNNKDYTLGLATTDVFLNNHDANNPKDVDYVLYLRGLMHYNFTNTFLIDLFDQDLYKRDISGIVGAYNDFYSLTTHFPNSQYAKPAKEKMIAILNGLAEREYKIAKFYFDRKAYVATINRVVSLQKNYGNSSSTLPALELMRDSYKALNLDENVKSMDDAIIKAKQSINSDPDLPESIKNIPTDPQPNDDENDMDNINTETN